MTVAPSAASAAAENERLPVGHINDDLSGRRILYHCSGRNGKDYILCISAVKFVSPSVSAVLRDEFVTEPVFKQSVVAVLDR